MKRQDEVEKTIESYEQCASEYQKKHSDIKESRRLIDCFLGHFGGKKILDVGCGPGRDAKYLSDAGFDVTGIDLTSGFIEMAKKNAEKADFLKMDMRKLKFKANSFDGIWSCASLLHIPKKDVKNTLLGFWRVLKPEGLMYIGVKDGAGERIVDDKKYLSNQKPRFFAYYDKKEISEIVENAGFKILDIKVQKGKTNWINLIAKKKKSIKNINFGKQK